MPQSTLADLVEAIDTCGPMLRRRLWHDAAEFHHEDQILSALHAFRGRRPPPVAARPRIAVTCCIDDREESFRRALEALGPDVRTHGHAGFFGFPMRYQGFDDASAYPLCPVNIDPAVLVEERAAARGSSEERARVERRRMAARALHEVHEAARTPGRGTLLSLAFAPIQGLLLAARVIAPRRARGAERAFVRRLLPHPPTELTIERRAETPPPSPTGQTLQLGFSSEELVNRAATLLENLGAISDHARLFVFLGHGSGSFNNPHRSAYDCGACGGRHGAANARVAASVLNRADVRASLAERGIHIPADTWFIGGFHHTGDDSVQLFDLEALPPSHADDLARLRADLDRARAENAFERCRRFESAARVDSPEGALRHVENRCEHLAEPRPELGHATNAVAIVGRRDLTRGLFLDRRAFLVCHDPTRDPGTRILERLLAAVGPVGAGINLEYWFSRVDNDRYGAGTKLPHNVSGLLGVVSGAGGDLRTGLPWQMVEIHDPLRLLLVIEATPEAVLTVASRQPEVAQLVVNGWVRVATVDPETGVIHVFREGAFVPWTPASAKALPEFSDSRSHWRGHLAHLPPAIIAESARAKDVVHA
jgi:uncharacterized protein YbcC (UPF0753/DUF2309 family)